MPTSSEPHIPHQGLKATQAASTMLEVQYRLAWLRGILRGVLAAILIMGLLFFMFGYSTLRQLKLAGALNTSAIQGEAYVVDKSLVWQGNPRNSRFANCVTFRLQEQEVTVQTQDVVKWQQTPVKTMLPVTYHLTQDHEIFITDWQITPAQR